MKIKKRPLGIWLLALFYAFIGLVIVLQPIAFVLLNRHGQALPTQAWGTIGFTWLIGALCLTGAWGLWVGNNITRLALTGVSGITFIHYTIQYFQGHPNPIGYFLFLLFQIVYLFLPGVKRHFMRAVEVSPPLNKKQKATVPIADGKPKVVSDTE
jgi:hypothetical protein